MTPTELANEVARLNSIFERAQQGAAKWKEVWAQVSMINGGFKEVRFSSSQDRKTAWDNFRYLMAQINEQREQADQNRYKQEEQSRKIRERIEYLLHNALTYDPTNTEIIMSALAWMIPGANIIKAYQALIGEEEKLSTIRDILKVRSGYLEDARKLFSEERNNLTFKDREDIRHTISHVQATLQEQWDELNNNFSSLRNEKRIIRENKKAEAEQKHAQWRQQTEEYIYRQIQNLDKFTSNLNNQKEYYARVLDQRDNARSKDFRESREIKLHEVWTQIENLERIIADISKNIFVNQQKLRDDPWKS